jgi:hypothetical protein
VRLLSQQLRPEVRRIDGLLFVASLVRLWSRILVLRRRLERAFNNDPQEYPHR